MIKELRILILEDRPADAELIMRELRKEGIQFAGKCVTTETEFLDQLRDCPPDLILADYSLPAYDGLSALAASQRECPEIPFIFVSGSMGEENAIEALHHGATDYVLKQRLARLGPAARRALREVEQRRHRAQVERHIHELNLLLRAIRHISQLIVRERNPQRLLAEACNVLVQTRGYSLAWVGLTEPGSQRVVPAAWAGDRADYLDNLEITWDEAATGQGPTGTAMRTGQPWVCQDTATGTGFAPWREAALARGYASGAAAPMTHGTRTVGALTVYSNRKDAFHEEELGLLKELAGDLAFALQSIENEQERKRAEAALRESESLYQSLVENVPQHIFCKDAAGRFTFGNGPFCKGLGKPLADILGKTDLDFFPAELAAKYRQDDLRVLQTGQPFEGEETFKQAGGESVIVNVLKTPLRDAAGQIVGIQGISWDITERRQAQEALTASEANYRSLVESSPDAIFLHREETFVYANSAGLALLGAEKPQQVLGRSVFDIGPPENRDLIRQRIGQAAEGGRTPPLEQKILRLDGTSLDAEVTSIPFTYEGKPAVQSVMRDITERKQLEQQLRQSQKMEAIGQLAGGVAHDFNNMLAVIRGNAELLLMDPDQHTPQTIECLKQVTAASERAANLTRQLLAFSRKQVMQSRPLVLNDVVADLTKMLRRIIGEHIDLQCRYGAQLPFVQADAGMIEQVLLNLAVNARDAMPRGGQLLITTETASFDAAYARTHPEADAGEFVCLTVGDTGTGIAPEHLSRIFEPFFTTKELGKGTGLGLATVYGIVKQHEGWIEVSSQIGAGATFKTFLPAIPTPVGTAATDQAETKLPGGTETILLVEDEYAVRMITRRVLESHGYKIYEATTAAEALDLWRSRREEVALLLTDIVMPQGITGCDLAEQLRASRPTLKVILMSGYSADVVGKDTNFFRRSKSYFLQKPCSARALLETVRSCLDAK